MRREWIEITTAETAGKQHNSSPSMRREWIEIFKECFVDGWSLIVSLHAEGVD